MKTTVLYILLGVTIFSYNTSASEVEFRVTDMTYTWGDIADFELTGYQIGATRYIGNTGVRVMVGQSDTVTNSIKGSHAGEYTQQMQNFWVFNIHHRWWLDGNLSAQLGVNYSEYRSCTQHSCNPDTGVGYSIALQEHYANGFSFKVSYDTYYEKDSKWVGKEITKGSSMSIVYEY